MNPIIRPDKFIDTSPLLLLRGTHPLFQVKEVKKIKVRALEQLSTIDLSESSRCYYLHQLSQVHELDPLVLLVQEINQRLEGCPSN